jgi:hypothetical protein
MDGHGPLKLGGRIGVVVGLVVVALGLLSRRDDAGGPAKLRLVEPALAIDPPSLTKAPARGFDPAAAEPHESLPHSHPMTPKRIWIQHENQLVGAMNDAVDLADGPRLRRILTTYRERYPEDPSQLEEGYGLIADCLEHPSAQSKAAAQRYYDEERGSILRLFVARHCLQAE